MQAKTALVTGCLGNVGVYVTKKLLSEGYKVTGVDNNGRELFLGKDGDVSDNLKHIQHENFQGYAWDIRTIDWGLNRPDGFDVIVHAAAQVSHPRSIEIPYADFEVNAMGTIRLLEYARNHCTDPTFIFISSSKVYGENVNSIPIVEGPTRYSFDPLSWGVSENVSVDQTLHTPFGTSKLYADIVTQEYGKLYGLKTCVLRPNCMAGAYSKPTVYQRWEAFVMKKVLTGEPLTIFGFGGKQLRDIIHCEDVADVIYEIVERPPRRGEVFNIGGGKGNTLSVNELIAMVEQTAKVTANVSHGPKREADWAVYYTDNSKLMKEYPEWKITRSISDIINELYDGMAPSLLQRAHTSGS